MAVLSFLDFFPTGVQVQFWCFSVMMDFPFLGPYLDFLHKLFPIFFQRVALSTAANMCKKLPPDAADFVMDAVPLLTNLLQCQDSKVTRVLH